MPTTIRAYDFDTGNPLDGLPETDQTRYLSIYLTELGASSVVEEPRYFDRDFLAEFQAFHCTSARNPGNLSKRLHFFKGPKWDRRRLRRFLQGSERVVRSAQENYLGFIVVRPVAWAPLGRTVLAWYPDRFPSTPRVVEPSRPYTCHLGGIPLSVNGLAWQQQDSAVGACATVALWSILHSSAFTDRHAVPTTAEVTERGHRRASGGHRVYPSNGMAIGQILEVIKESGLEPEVVWGRAGNSAHRPALNAEKFAIHCSALIRSGFPVLLGGSLCSRQNPDNPRDLSLKPGVPHAVCVVGIRDVIQSPTSSVSVTDVNVEYFYLHDDNIGPNVRFRLGSEPHPAAPTAPHRVAVLRPERPSSSTTALQFPDPVAAYGVFVPEVIVAAVPREVRLPIEEVVEASAIAAAFLSHALRNRGQPQAFALSVRYSTVADYLGRHLQSALGGSPALLAKARLGIMESAQAMSLRVGVGRISGPGGAWMDVLFDTSDSTRNLRPVASVIYAPVVSQALNSGALAVHRAWFGDLVRAF